MSFPVPHIPALVNTHLMVVEGHMKDIHGNERGTVDSDELLLLWDCARQHHLILTM